MKTYNLAKIGGVALAASLMASSAFAGTLTAPAAPLNYAVQAVSANSGVVTVPAGTIQYTPAAAVQTSVLIRFTLPSGMTFVNTPTISVSPAGAAAYAGTVSLSGGGAGSQFALFTFSGATLAAANVISLGAFQVNTGTTLSAPITTALNVSAQLTGDTAGGANDATAVTKGVFLASNGATQSAAPSQLVVDLINGGTKFNAATGLAGSLNVGSPGTYTYSITSSLVQADGVTTYTAPTGSTATLTITGNYAGLSRAYLVPSAGACVASSASLPTGAISGTVSGTSLSFSSIAAAATANTICLDYNGTSGTALIPSGTANQLTATATVANSLGSLSSTALGPISNNGTTAEIKYTVGAASGYTSWVQIANNGTTAVPILGTFRTSTGTVINGTIIASLAPNTQQLLPIDTIFSNLGGTAQTTPFRGNLTVIAGSTLVSVTGLVISPNGTAAQLGN